GLTRGRGAEMIESPDARASAMIIHCPACSRRLELPAEAMGQELKCPGCQRVFTAEETPERAGRSARTEGGPQGEAAEAGGRRGGGRGPGPGGAQWVDPGAGGGGGGERGPIRPHRRGPGVRGAAAG